MKTAYENRSFTPTGLEVILVTISDNWAGVADYVREMHMGGRGE